ncbi:MAG: CHRD domain-containing protein [Pseudolabrys sp.]|nr:CHRD domain-containing protein [Pseudolabrys sp.]MBV9262191.1 CHRD domain-containing protein [Pseudolabrys sp.]
MTFIRPAVTALTCAAALTVAVPALAETVNLKADMNAASEVPANSSKATGTVTASYDTASKKLSWKGSYKDLTGPATAAHFHGPAEAGKNAGVMVPISPATSPFEGSATLNDDQAKALMAGELYVNVHTAENKGGEIRGQLKK